MLKKSLLILIVVSLGLFAVSCGKRKQKYPDGSDKVSEYATINSVKQVFLAMDDALAGNIALAAKASYSVKEGDALASAYAWGRLCADAMAAIQAQNSGKLQTVYAQFVKIAPMLSLSEEAGLFEQRAKELLRKRGWKDLEILMSGFRSTVEVKLLDAEKNDLYTLMALGEWAEVTSLGAAELGKAPNASQSVMLRQSEAWENLAGNLALLTNNPEADPAFAKAETAVRDLLKLLQAMPEADLSAEQLAAVSAAGVRIHNVFQP